MSFSKESLPQPGGTYVSKSGDKRDSERSHLQKHATSGPGRRSKFSPEEDELLVQLKEGARLLWDEIADQFPERSKGPLQVRYRCLTYGVHISLFANLGDFSARGEIWHDS